MLTASPGTGHRQSFLDEYCTQFLRLADRRSADLSLLALDQQRKLAELARTATQEAQQASRAKSDFLANISHELRTPLNAIIGFSELMGQRLAGPVDGSKFTEYANDITASGHHLLALINDILDLARIESGKAGLNEEVVRLDDVVDACIGVLKGAITAGGIVFENHVPADLSSILADKVKLKQVVLNLLSNAIKFTPKGGRVGIEAEIDDAGGLALWVADTGIGIAPEDIERVFEPFTQIENAMTKRYAGTGLGLPLCSELVKLHGGTIEIESQPGVGTTVTVRFPADRIVCAEEARAIG